MSIAYAEVSGEARRFHLEIDADFMRSGAEEQRRVAAAALRYAAWNDNLTRVKETSPAIDGQIGASVPHPRVIARDAYIEF